jgi:hypothetical protein
VLFQGILKGPQLAGILFVLGGAALLLDRPSQRITNSAPVTPDTAPTASTEQTHG